MAMDADYTLVKKVAQLVRPEIRRRLWASKPITAEDYEYCGRHCEYTAKYSFC